VGAELEEVLELGAVPAVDGLRVVADDRQPRAVLHKGL